MLCFMYIGDLICKFFCAWLKRIQCMGSFESQLFILCIGLKAHSIVFLLRCLHFFVPKINYFKNTKKELIITTLIMYNHVFIYFNVFCS